MKTALAACQERESTIDFEGRIALVFFTQGCNFRCRFCHNPELIPIKDVNMSYDEVGRILSRARENWVDGVCITGGEPTMQKDIAATAAFIKKAGMDLKLDTQGSFPGVLKEVIPHCDYIAMDYKAPMEKYPFITNVKVKPDSIRESLGLLAHGDVPYEIRTTVIPGIHDEDDIRAICRELHGVRKFVLQTFVPRDNLPDEELRTTEKTSRALLERYADICRNSFEEVVVR